MFNNPMLGHPLAAWDFHIKDCTPRFAMSVLPLMGHQPTKQAELVDRFGGDAARAVAEHYHPHRDSEGG